MMGRAGACGCGLSCGCDEGGRKEEEEEGRGGGQQSEWLVKCESATKTINCTQKKIKNEGEWKEKKNITC